MDKKGNDLCYAVKFENHVKNKNNFFIKQNISFYLNHFFFYSSKSFFFMSPKNSIASAFFLPRQIQKNIDMPRQKLLHLLTAKANSECCCMLLLAEILLILKITLQLFSAKPIFSCILDL